MAVEKWKLPKTNSISHGEHPHPKSRRVWIKLFSRGHHPLLYVDSVMTAHRDLFHGYFGLPRINHWVRHSGSLWVEQGKMAIMNEAIHRKLGTFWPERMVKKMKSDLLALNRFAAHPQPNTEYLRKAFALMGPAWQATYFPILIGKILEEEIVQRINGFSQTQKERVLFMLHQPLYSSMQLRYHRDLANRAHLDKQEIQKFQQHYGWIKGYVMDVKPLTEKMLRHDWQQARKKRTQRGVSAHVHVDAHLARLIRLGRLYCWFRDWRLFQISRCFYSLKPALEAYGKTLHLYYADVCQLRMHELFSGIFSRQTLQQRKEGFAILLMNGDVRVVSGKGVRRIQQEVHEPMQQTHVVHGVSATSGRVKGRVWIADAYSFARPHSGDVLVTAETTPDALQYLRRVKAIITDEGGITSHAAIISRELGIPCVIGTKIATSVFKDGDLVEVDAEKGVVRKLT